MDDAYDHMHDHDDSEPLLMQKTQPMVVIICHPDGPRARHHDARGTLELPLLIAFAAPHTSLDIH